MQAQTAVPGFDRFYFFCFFNFYIMRKNLFLTLALAFVTLTGAFAQNWSLTLSAADGLPGKKYTVAADGSISEDGNTMYLYTSDLVTPDAPLSKLRVTFRETQGGNALNGYPFTNLSELQIFEKDGKTLIPYTATSNADHNTVGGSTDGAGLAGLNDGDWSNYWHSAWGGSVAEYHYLELDFGKDVSEFIIAWGGRPGSYFHNSPTLVGLTPAGVDFVPYGEWNFSVSKDKLTTLEDLLAAEYFVMKSNVPVEYHAYVNNENSDQPFGTQTTKEPNVGPGPMFVRGNEQAEAASPSYAIKLIETDEEGKYYFYFVSSGKFLSIPTDGGQWNGANGVQGLTGRLSEAAKVSIKQLSNGDFEFSYAFDNNGTADVMYMGATPSTGGSKNFNAERKAFYDKGNPYCMNYSYVCTFNWSLYTATLNYPAKYASLPIVGAIEEAEGIYTFMDSVAVEGYESDFDAFMDALNTAKDNVAKEAYKDVLDVFAAVDELNDAAGWYVFSKICWLADTYFPTLEEYKDSCTMQPQPGFYPMSAYNTYIQHNLIDSVAYLYNNADKDDNPYAYMAQMKAFINIVQPNVDAFFASKVVMSTLPAVFTTDAPDDKGLGTLNGSRYDWSQDIILSEAVNGIRLTFLETVNGNSANGGKYNGYPMVVLSSLQIVGSDGTPLVLTTDMVSSNSVETTEGSLADLFDDDANTYYHSIWGNGTMSPEGYVYLDVKFPEGVELSSFTIKTGSRNDRVALAPSTVCVTEYGVEYDPALFRENPYNVCNAVKVTDLSQIEDGGVYIISGNLRVKTKDATPRYYSGAAPYHTNVKAALNDPCAYMFKKTANGWNIISLANAKYWALNKNVDEETNEVAGYSTGLTAYPEVAAEVQFAKSNNLENTWVIYSNLEDYVIGAQWSWTNPEDENDVVTVDSTGVNANKFVFMDWDGSLAGRPCVSAIPGEFEHGLDALGAHAKFEDFKNGDGYSAGDYLHFNKANGEGEWNIYKVSMDDPYYCWLNAIPSILSELGVIVGNDPGCIKGDIAEFEAAVNDVEAAIENENKAAAQGAVEAFVAAISSTRDAERVEVEPNYWYAIESAYTEYYKQQGKVKAIYATTSGLAWKDAPKVYNTPASAEFVFQFQPYDADISGDISEEDAPYAFYLYNDKVEGYVGLGTATDQVTMTENDLFYAKPYIVKPLEGDIYTVRPLKGDNTNPLHTAGHGNGAGKNGTIVHWGGEAGTASSWRIRFVDSEEPTSVSDLVVEGSEVVSVAYFTAAGAAIPAPVKGINIVVTIYANGVIETKKVLVK